MRSSSDSAFGGGMKSPLSNLPALPSIFLPPRGLLRRERRRPASGGGMYVVCGVAVSPGVPMRSARGSEGRSLPRLALLSTRSFGVIVGGGVGTGARSPGRMPAFNAAAVGRKTLTCREGGGGGGGGVTLTSVPFVGATTSGAVTGASATTGGRLGRRRSSFLHRWRWRFDFLDYRSFSTHGRAGPSS